METSEMVMVTAFVGGLVLWFVIRTQAERSTEWVTFWGCMGWCGVCVCWGGVFGGLSAFRLLKKTI